MKVRKTDFKLKMQKFKLKCVFLFFVLSLICSSLKAQNEMFKALYIYNFTKYIKWENSENSETLVILIFGKSEIENELKDFIATKSALNQAIEVKTVNTLDALSEGKIIFIPRNKSNKLPDIIRAVRNKQILIITDRKGLKGAHINFIDDDFSLDFEINSGKIRALGFELSDELIKLGKEVYE